MSLVSCRIIRWSPPARWGRSCSNAPNLHAAGALLIHLLRVVASAATPLRPDSPAYRSVKFSTDDSVYDTTGDDTTSLKPAVTADLQLHLRRLCQWRSKMSHLWRLRMSHSAGGDVPVVRRRLPAASLPPRLIVPHLTAGGLEGLVELGVVAHAVAVAADAHDVAVVEQAVDQRGRHDLVAKDLAPLLEALVAGEHG